MHTKHVIKYSILSLLRDCIVDEPHMYNVRTCMLPKNMYISRTQSNYVYTALYQLSTTCVCVYENTSIRITTLYEFKKGWRMVNYKWDIGMVHILHPTFFIYLYSPTYMYMYTYSNRPVTLLQVDTVRIRYKV